MNSNDSEFFGGMFLALIVFLIIAVIYFYKFHPSMIKTAMIDVTLGKVECELKEDDRKITRWECSEVK